MGLLDFLNKAIKDGTATETRVNAAALGVGTRTALPEGFEPQDETEAQFQQRVIDEAHAQGWTVAHFRAVRIARADGTFYFATPVQADGEGFPDLVMIRAGDREGVAGATLLVVELKVKGNVASERQVMWLDLFRLTGCAAGVWRPEDWDDIVRTLAMA